MRSRKAANVISLPGLAASASSAGGAQRYQWAEETITQGRCPLSLSFRSRTARKGAPGVVLRRSVRAAISFIGRITADGGVHDIAYGAV